MCFEVLESDLLGRIGRIETKRGYIETPMLLPVIHPVKQEVSLEEIRKIGFYAIITNAYITMKHYSNLAIEKGIHEILGFDGVVMTDSGGYQILTYGKIDFSPEQIAEYEKAIKTDIAVILDTPTGSTKDKERARETVTKTLEAAKRTMNYLKEKGKILWCGTIQGGRFLDLIEYSAKELVKMDFDLLALGSPTEFMESYNFEILSKMIITAKRNIPLDKPLHLFGAGHTLTIPLGVALGCDIFDSASYILFAKNLRYIDSYGTYRLEELSNLPCNCPICSNHTQRELLEDEERVKKLALHNLYALMEEIKRVKQSIKEGRLWDYLSLKANAHPNLKRAFSLIAQNSELLEDGTPLFKPRALFFKDYDDLRRPEIIRFEKRIGDLRLPDKEIGIIIESPKDSPLLLSKVFKNIMKELKNKIQFFSLLNPWGIIPVEISDLYPLSQYLCSLKLDVNFVVREFSKILSKRKYKRLLIFYCSEELEGFVKELENLKARGIKIKNYNKREILKVLKEHLSIK
ncbi:MAG: tRNA guanosine(15) transglycosylase TgtA [Nitrososphaerales archaeon]